MAYLFPKLEAASVCSSPTATGAGAEAGSFAAKQYERWLPLVTALPH